MANFVKTDTGERGGVQVATYALGKTESETVDITGSQFRGFPNEELTITALSTNATEVTVGVTFRQFL